MRVKSSIIIGIKTHHEARKQYGGHHFVRHSSVDVDYNQIVDGEPDDQEETEQMCPNVHCFVRPPKYAAMRYSV